MRVLTEAEENEIRRGAEAGRSLGLALREVGLGEIAIRAAIAALTLMLAAEPASACHRFSRWYYPWPQRCSAPRIIRVSMREIEPQPAAPALPPASIEPVDDFISQARFDAIERLKTELAHKSMGKPGATLDFTAVMPRQCPGNLALGCEESGR